jgi:hypothetical protein
VGGEGHGGEFLVGDLDAAWVVAVVVGGFDGQSGASGGGGDELDDDFMGEQWPASPVEGDLGEQSVLDLG